MRIKQKEKWFGSAAKGLLLAGGMTLVWAAGAWAEPATKGGTLTVRLSAWPESFNALTGGDTYSGMLHNFVHITLLDRSMKDFEPIPSLATKWELAKDRKTMTFQIRKDVTFADGSPVTIEDVKFSYELTYDIKRCVKCEDVRSYIGPMEWVKVVDDKTIQVKAKNEHFENVERFGAVPILKKAHYEKKDFNKDYERDLFGAGPYVYDDKGSTFRKTVVLKRRSGYWMEKDPYYGSQYNFDKIVFKLIEDDTVAWEAFKKKDLDFYTFGLKSYKWWDDATKAPFTDKNMGRITAPLIYPSSWGGVALNMRKGPLSDVKFRKALQFAFNRELMINKLFQNHFRPVSGPFAYKSKYSADLAATPYDVKKAGALIKEAGFTKVGSDGVLYREVNGVKERASFELMYATNAHDQWITMYKEDLKKLGVELRTKLTDWSAAQKQLSEFKFDSFVIGWAGDPTPGPEQLFSGKYADIQNSSNYSGLKNPKIDELIEKAPIQTDANKRVAMYKEMEKLIVDAQPYIFRWTDKEHLVAYWKDRLNPTATPFYKYSGSAERKSFFVHWMKAK
jgi:microcin C transport system substrate-binding protein